MAKFYVTSGISHKLEDIIKNAKKDLYLVSPYLQINDRLLERLSQTSDKGVVIHIVYGKDKLKTKELDSLKQIEKLELIFSKDLHAKCYFNEIEMLITSMNMYEYSIINNREMGVLLNAVTDKTVYEDAKNETFSIIKAAKKKINGITKAVAEMNTKKVNNKKSSLKGKCIRCGNNIKLNPSTPLCKDCYSVWKQYGDEEYQEEFCHICGNAESTSILKPTCYSCYKKNKNKLEFKI